MGGGAAGGGSSESTLPSTHRAASAPAPVRPRAPATWRASCAPCSLTRAQREPSLARRAPAVLTRAGSAGTLSSPPSTKAATASGGGRTAGHWSGRHATAIAAPMSEASASACVWSVRAPTLRMSGVAAPTSAERAMSASAWLPGRAPNCCVSFHLSGSPSSSSARSKGPKCAESRFRASTAAAALAETAAEREKPAQLELPEALPLPILRSARSAAAARSSGDRSRPTAISSRRSTDTHRRALSRRSPALANETCACSCSRPATSTRHTARKRSPSSSLPPLQKRSSHSTSRVCSPAVGAPLDSAAASAASHSLRMSVRCAAVSPRSREARCSLSAATSSLDVDACCNCCCWRAARSSRA